MDQQYWMWMMMRSSLRESTWEEKVAEDAAGALGGCLWPPRSYSCSFCRREFRSAQALGGHMNVHRRDRARLKQSQISDSHNVHVLHHPQNHTGNPTKLFDDPNSSTLNVFPALAPAATCSPSRVSDPSMKRNLNISDHSTSVGFDGSCVETNLSVGLSSVFSQNRPTASCTEEAIISCTKRPKIAVTARQFFVSNDRFKANSMEDLDLELRLGTDPPKVK
ncbi:hypothetical protein SLEP1_g5776 [Rubroshorea leprosula]|uniref:C2H2-type domain-containing protein n=1 Tax=Rubroshorea leprosula TaxID=152421 RepID=A0AAV5HYV5_9ROSI|nr:hypothetical protein SLEP1_g5776 [Rubroshorea leprosula]